MHNKEILDLHGSAYFMHDAPSNSGKNVDGNLFMSRKTIEIDIDLETIQSL